MLESGQEGAVQRGAALLWCCEGYGLLWKDQWIEVIAICATCKLCTFKSPSCKSYDVKSKAGNCLLCFGCIKHAEKIHYLLDLKDLEEAPIQLKDHWDSFRGNLGKEACNWDLVSMAKYVGRLYEGFGCESAEKKRCLANFVCLCTVENLPLHNMHPHRVCEVLMVVGACMAKHIETKHDQVNGAIQLGIVGRHWPFLPKRT